MAFINIPESNYSASVAIAVGKLQGLLNTKVNELTNKVVEELSQNESIPLEKLEKLTTLKNRVTGIITKANRKITSIKEKTEKLKPPLAGLKVAIDLILSIPIPQAVPPGVGIPVNVTTKYSDQLVTLKETSKQINETVQSVDSIIEQPSKTIKRLKEKTSKLEAGLILGKGESKLNSFLSAGKIGLDVLIRTGIADSDGFTEFAKIRPGFIKNIDSSSLEDVKLKIDELNRKIQNSNEIDQSLKDEFGKLLVFTPYTDKQNRAQSGLYSYKGFNLEIVEDLNSPSIARRHYAQAINNRGVIVAKSPSSFSSNVEVLIDELKFIIDNQLI